MTLILRFRLAVIILLICISSGWKEINNIIDAVTDTQELKVFNGDVTSLQYNIIASEEEKWQFLARIAGETYQNKLNVKDWIDHNLTENLKILRD